MTKQPGAKSARGKQGSAFERCIAAIHAAVLRSGQTQLVPRTKLVIETNKKIVKGGVTHEFDVWIEVPIAPGYPPTIYAFECKDRGKPVGKGALSDFADKMHDVGVDHGFIVATAFTKDARNYQARKFPKIELLEVQKYPISSEPFAFHWLGVEEEPLVRVVYNPYDAPRTDIDFSKAILTVKGRPIDLAPWVLQQINKYRPTMLREFLDSRPAAGATTLVRRLFWKQAWNGMFLDQIEIKQLGLELHCRVDVLRPAEVVVNDPSRGLAVSYAPVELAPGVMVRTTVTSLATPFSGVEVVNSFASP